MLFSNSKRTVEFEARQRPEYPIVKQSDQRCEPPHIFRQSRRPVRWVL
jgi:hypothetical protein